MNKLFKFLNWVFSDKKESEGPKIEWGSEGHANKVFLAMCRGHSHYSGIPNAYDAVEPVSLGFGVWAMSFPKIGYVEMDLSQVSSLVSSCLRVDSRIAEEYYKHSRGAIWC